METQQNLVVEIKKLADICVKCGLCVSKCPTYHITENEAESPRGRIQLMKYKAIKGFENTKHIKDDSIDNCLLCKTCEVVCPAEVKYEKLLHHYRTLSLINNKSTLLPLYLHIIIKFIRVRNGLHYLSFLYKLLKIEKIFKKLNFFGSEAIENYSNYLSDKIKFLKLRNKKTSTSKTPIILLKGCFGEISEPEVLCDLAKFLNYFNYEVIIPKNQACCGALHYHAGDEKTALKLMKDHIKDFNNNKSAILLSSSTGCSAFLKHYPDLLPEFKDFTFWDLTDFLEKISLETVNFKPYPKRVFLHTPCSQHNNLQKPDLYYRILNLIPEINLIKNDYHFCCGSAGANMIINKKYANMLREKLFDEIFIHKPEIILTSNIGCKLHLKAFLNKNNVPINIMHPIQLIYKNIIKKY